MQQLLYKIIYDENVNFLLRNTNKFLYPLLPKKVLLPPSGVLKIKNAEGKILKISTNQTSYISKLIFWNGYRNFEYTDIFIKLIKKVGSFYDVGANIGYYSLIAAMENEHVRVVGFEPAAGPLFYFRHNVSINKFKNIEIEAIALSHKEGEIDFYEIKNKKYKYLEHNLGGESNAGSKTTGRNFMVHKVKTTTLDNYVKAKNEKSIDLIKMDTEGTENLILENSSEVLKTMKPLIICETLFNTIEPDLDRIMRSFGYEFYNFTEGGLVKQDTIVRSQDNGVRNCIFVHPTKSYLIKEFLA